MRRLLTSAAVLAFCLAGSAEATIFKLTVKGTITSTYGWQQGKDGSSYTLSDPQLGTPVTLIEFFDDAKATIYDTNYGYHSVLYGFPTATVAWTVGSWSFATSATAYQDLQLSFADNSYDYYQGMNRIVDRFSTSLQLSGDPAVLTPFVGTQPTGFSIGYSFSAIASSATAISDLYLHPTSTLVGFDQFSLGMVANWNGGQKSFTATASSATLEAVTGVPEASTWTLTILGFGMIGAAVRRSRARHVRAAVSC